MVSIDEATNSWDNPVILDYKKICRLKARFIMFVLKRKLIMTVEIFVDAHAITMLILIVFHPQTRDGNAGRELRWVVGPEEAGKVHVRKTTKWVLKEECVEHGSFDDPNLC